MVSRQSVCVADKIRVEDQETGIVNEAICCSTAQEY